MSSQVTATATSVVSAIPFEVNDNGDGTFSIHNPELDYGALHCDASKAVVGWATNATASYWTLTCTVDGQKEIFETQLIELMARAEEILTELIVDYSVGMDGIDMAICADVTPFVGADSLLTWACALQEYVFFHNFANCRLVDCVDNIQGVVNAIASLVDHLSAGYRKALYLPETSTEETLVLYHIRNVENGYYCYEEKEQTRYLGYIRTKDVAIEDLDESLQWYFMPADTDSTFYIINYATRQGVHNVSGKSYVAMLEGNVAEAYKITIDAEGNGFVISTVDDKNWYCNASSYVQVSKSKTALWKLAKVGTAASIGVEELGSADDAMLYDLQGRPVANPTHGIYIRQGVKVVY